MLTFDQLVVAITPAEMEQQLLTSLQGVTPVLQGGANSGAIVGTGDVLAAGPAIAAASAIVQIVASGQVGAGTFKYSLDGGNTYSATTTIPSSGIFLLSAINVTLTFSNGLSTPSGGSFQVGETYTFSTTTPTFPITNWTQGSTPMGFVKMERDALADLSTLITQIASGGLVTSWITPPAAGPPPSGWLDLLAQGVYNLARIQAQYTTGIVVLSCASTAGPYTIAIGSTVVNSQAGQLFYVSALPNGATLSSGGTLAVQVQAQQSGASYNSVLSTPPSPTPGANYITTLVTPLAGVTVSNPLQAAPAVTHVGAGGGVVTVTGTPTAEIPILIEITASGAVGTGTFKYSTNGGQTFSAALTIASTYALGSGMTANFSGTFAFSDSYSATTSWIVQYGTDTESNLSLALRCQGQWAALGPGSPSAIYTTWAQLASPEVVTVYSFPDPSIAGQVDIVLAGAGGSPVSSTAVSLVQAYIAARVPEGVTAEVLNIQQLTVTVGVAAGGGIYVPTAQLAAAQAAIATALFNKQLQIGAGGIVYYDQIVAIVEDAAGVDHVELLTINGGTSDLQLLQFQAASFSGPSSGSYVTI